MIDGTISNLVMQIIFVGDKVSKSENIGPIKNIRKQTMNLTVDFSKKALNCGFIWKSVEFNLKMFSQAEIFVFKTSFIYARSQEFSV